MRWYVLYCKNGYRYHERLMTIPVRVFDPVYIHVSVSGNRFLSKKQKLCPGYVFIQCDLTKTSCSLILSVPGVIKFLKFDSQFYEAPEHLICSLQDLSVKTDDPKLKYEIERISQAKTREEREIQFLNFLKKHQ